MRHQSCQQYRLSVMKIADAMQYKGQRNKNLWGKSSNTINHANSVFACKV